MVNAKAETYIWVVRDITRITQTNFDRYPNLGSGTSASGNGYRVFCPGLDAVHALLSTLLLYT